MNWSKETINLTKKILDDVPGENFLAGYVVMKNSESEFGRITTMDAINYKYNILEMYNDEVLVSYSSLDALIADGWVID
jgi:hypothetical protein